MKSFNETLETSSDKELIREVHEREIELARLDGANEVVEVLNKKFDQILTCLKNIELNQRRFR